MGEQIGTFQEIDSGEYIVPYQEDEDSNKVIASWLMEKPVYRVKAKQSNLEPSYSSGDQLETTVDPWFATPMVKHFPKDQCDELDIGLLDQPRNILVSKHLTPDKQNTWKKFFMGFSSTFAWSYKDLKGIPPEVCEHHIILEEGAKPIRQRQRRLNLKYSFLVKEEIDKLLNIGFIYPVPFSEWVSPIVIVPKKNGKIRICQDFRALNKATKKDYFPLPFTDAILDAVAGHECYSFLDGFLGYNQVRIAQENQVKTTFTMDWGTFAFRVMLFGLCNAPATF